MENIGVCGNDCSLCPRYVATKSRNVKRLKELSKLWKMVGWRENVERPEEMLCHGCTSVEWCRYKTVRNCAQAREIDNCGQCDYYPCDKSEKVFDQTKLYAEFCLEKLSKEDYVCFEKAFFSKKENLDKIQQGCKST
ncbi:MAG: DUF3795 domain-containing protein [Planctomycetota bacterium]|jgi:hypothetical protein